MAGVVPRKGGKYEGWYMDSTGKKRRFTGTPNRSETERMAQALEAEQLKIKHGLVDSADVRRRAASTVPLVDHLDAFRDSILDAGGSETYAKSRRSTVLRLLADAGITTIADLPVDAIQSAIGRLKKARSARTANDALGAVKQFLTWLEDTNRIKEFPRSLKQVRRHNEATDRRRVRRALTAEEVERLLTAAENGPTLTRDPPLIERPKGCGRGGWGQKGRSRLVPITGLQRATLYRLALGTGFRANELRSLTPESFQLEGDNPTVTLSAKVSKNKRESVQPIRRDLAAWLAPIIASIEPGEKVVPVPEKTADLIRRDLKTAGIPYETGEGVCDFHCLRGTFVSILANNPKNNPKTVQKLARHSTITLTFDTYTSHRADDSRKALEGGEGE